MSTPSCTDFFLVLAALMDKLIQDITLDQFAWYCLEFVRERGVGLAMKLSVGCKADVASLFARDTCWHMGISCCTGGFAYIH